ncbi:adenosine receptor A2a [Nephila pilipes]|uniref:Adenosine receptor A2a n=1 Tax=Nephila pilipes TaxID=299642 RepID=A0A8X6TPZ7_NEPPI|nr:adenosine receptor A2a [Nephila pilipes]
MKRLATADDFNNHATIHHQLRQITALEQQLPRNGSGINDANHRNSSRHSNRVPGSTSSSERSLHRNLQRIQSPDGTPDVRPQQASKREVRTAKNLAIIVVFFMICWIPLYTVNCVQAFCSKCQVPTWLLDAFIILSHVNSALNPFLYAYHMSDFRLALRKRFCCGGPGERNCTFRMKPRNVEMESLSAPALTKMASKMADAKTGFTDLS